MPHLFLFLLCAHITMKDINRSCYFILSTDTFTHGEGRSYLSCVSLSPSNSLLMAVFPEGELQGWPE